MMVYHGLIKTLTSSSFSGSFVFPSQLYNFFLTALTSVLFTRKEKKDFVPILTMHCVISQSFFFFFCLFYNNCVPINKISNKKKNKTGLATTTSQNLHHTYRNIKACVYKVEWGQRLKVCSDKLQENSLPRSTCINLPAGVFLQTVMVLHNQPMYFLCRCQLELMDSVSRVCKCNISDWSQNTLYVLWSGAIKPWFKFFVED